MPSPDRIRTMRHVEAMAALDTMPLLAERVRNLLSHGRRISMTRRYTYLDREPELKVGLTADPDGIGDGGAYYMDKPDAKHLGVTLRPGLMEGFGFGAYAGENDTEEAAWKRYHAAKSVSDDHFQRRRNMTLVEITGGMAGDSAARDDLLIIRHWNGDGVCEEVVVGFDTGLLWDARDKEATDA